MLITICFEREKSLNVTFPILNAWLRNQLFQFYDNIKIFFQTQMLKFQRYYGFKKSEKSIKNAAWSEAEVPSGLSAEASAKAEAKNLKTK